MLMYVPIVYGFLPEINVFVDQLKILLNVAVIKKHTFTTLPNHHSSQGRINQYVDNWNCLLTMRSINHFVLTRLFFHNSDAISVVVLSLIYGIVG